TQNVSGAQSALRQPILFVVSEEEGLVFSLEQPRNGDRAANLEARLIQNDIGSWSPASYGIGWQVAIVEPIVSVESRSAIIPITATVIFVAATLRDEFDLKR